MNFSPIDNRISPAVKRRAVIRRASLLASLLLTSVAAAGQVWDGGGSSSNWSDPLNWTGDALPDNQTITFSGDTRTTNTADYVPSSYNGLQWQGTSHWTVNPGSGVDLVLKSFNGQQSKIENLGTGLVTIHAPVTFAATTGPLWGEINATNGNLTFATNPVSVGGSLFGVRLYGDGHVTTFNSTVQASGKSFATVGLNKSVAINAYFRTGEFYLMNGAVVDVATTANLFEVAAIRLGGDNNTGTGQNLTLGGTLRFNHPAGGLANTSQIYAVNGNSSGALAVESNNSSGTNTLTGSIFLDSNLKISQAAGGTLTLGAAGDFDLKGRTVELASAGTMNVNRIIENSTSSGSVNKSGLGTVVMSATNTYSGTTTITSGTLRANGARAVGGLGLTGSATGKGTVQVSSGGVLAGNGGTGAVQVNSGGIITAGTGAAATSDAGLLTTGDQTWASGGTYVAKFDAANGSAGTAWDKLSMGTLSVSATPTGKFNISVLNSSGGTLAFAAGQQFAIAQFTTAITAASLDSFALTMTGITVPSGYEGMLSLHGSSGNTLYVDVSESAPEPTTALLAGLGAVAVLGGRRMATRQ